MTSYCQSTFTVTPDQLELMFWKTRIFGVNAELVAESWNRNAAATVAVLGVVSTGALKAAERQLGVLQTTSAHLLSLLAGLPTSPQKTAKLVRNVAEETMAGLQEVREIIELTGDEILSTTHQHTVESVQQLRRHIRREDLY